MRLRIRGMLQATLRKRLPPKGREAERQKALPTIGRAQADRICACPPSLRRASGGTRSPFGAPPRLSPEAFARLAQLQAMLPGTRIPAGVIRLYLSQSRDCTSRTGRSTGVNDARSRPGAGRNAARGNRSRSTFESTLAKGPSVNEMGEDVTVSVTSVKGLSLKKRQRKPADQIGQARATCLNLALWDLRCADIEGPIFVAIVVQTKPDPNHDRHNASGYSNTMEGHGFSARGHSLPYRVNSRRVKLEPLPYQVGTRMRSAPWPLHLCVQQRLPDL
jgi:hypothetical protein